MFFQALERVARIGTKHAGKSYTPKGLVHLIRSQFQDSQLRFYTLRDASLSSNDFLIKAEYRPIEDEDDEPCIFVGFTFSSRQKK